MRGRPLLKLLHQPLRLALRVSIPLAQLIALAGDDVNVLIGELAPLPRTFPFTICQLPLSSFSFIAYAPYRKSWNDNA